MKILMLNGSVHPDGCISLALREISRLLAEEGMESEVFSLGKTPIMDYIDCGGCANGHCVFERDGVNEFVRKAAQADGFIFATPVYYAHPSGRILSFLDRAFFSEHLTDYRSFRNKPAAAVACARRGGTTASLDVLGKYFGIAQMYAIGSTYWNMVHGQEPQDVLRDAEGLQTMRNLARNMAWVLKCLAQARAAGLCAPEAETQLVTNFVAPGNDLRT